MIMQLCQNNMPNIQTTKNLTQVFLLMFLLYISKRLWTYELMEHTWVSGRFFKLPMCLINPFALFFPNIGNHNVIKDLNRTVYCLDRTRNSQPCVNIMWTPMQIKRTRPCHFVPLLRVVRHNMHNT